MKGWGSGKRLHWHIWIGEGDYGLRVVYVYVCACARACTLMPSNRTGVYARLTLTLIMCVDTALTYLEEAAAVCARDDRWNYYTALTQQHMGHVSMQK